MENIQHKADFLRNKFTAILSELNEDAPRKWGKMNVRQMIEHMSDSMRIASGKQPQEIVTAEDIIPKMQAFLESGKPFRENTPNALMPDEPEAPKHATKEDAIKELQDEINDFFAAYKNEEGKTVKNPFFGVLNFNQQVQLLYKHSLHHLKQFGVDAQ